MTTTPTPASADGLTAQEAELQARARAFVDEVLIPLEEQAERAHGRLPAEAIARSSASRSSARLSGGLHSRRARRPGLDARRVVPRRGAVRALDERDLLARADRLQRARARLAGADRALPEAGAARRDARRLRGHRGARRLRPVGHPHDRRAHRRRLADPRREVVRHLRRRGRRLHRDGQRAGRRRVAADAVPRRPRHAGDLGRRRPAVHAQLPARPSDDRASTSRSARTR